MSWHGDQEAMSPDTGVHVGLLVASAMAPGTFAPSLSSRSAVDQGVITGLATGLHYLVTLGTQDTVQAAAAQVAELMAERSNGNGHPPRALADQRSLTFLADLAMVPLGLAVERLLAPRPGEAVVRGLLHQSGWRLAVTGLGGALSIAAETGIRALDDRLGARGRIATIPIAVPVGLAVAYLVDRARPHPAEVPAAGRAAASHPATAVTKPPAAKSMSVAIGVVGGTTALGYAEHLLASAVGRQLARGLPGNPQLWRLATHAAALGLLTAGATHLWGRAMRRIEAGTSVDERLFGGDEPTRWIGPTMSGGPGSGVGWTTLGREGRRHVLAHVRPEPITSRPSGLPDMSIATVMGEPARTYPVQVYVGLDSAGSARERVDLALAEMERTGAFDRSVIMLVSPTGTGYVNYVAVAAAQYLARGDIATVTMQYSKRPSPLALGMVRNAREQNRLLWLRILERIRDRPGPRPRIVLFGESLGAHTSQDVFLHWGTLGLQALGIDRALWIGTPYGSGWMHEVTGPDRLDVDRDTIGVFNDFAQLAQLDPDRRSRLRYVLVSHDNDGVTKFGPDLLVTSPTWLGPDRPRPESVADASPRGISPTLRWRPITTFFQSLVDMKNAQIPGPYRAWGHDYRPDLPAFISEVFDLPASPAQLAKVENVLQRRENLREELFAHHPDETVSPG